MTSGCIEDSLPCIETAVYAGPLDLLLDEVRRQKVDIEKIAMAPIVARFLEYLRTAAERSFNLDIEWLHMAATLIHWKSQSLLPVEGERGPGPDPIREQLIQQLVVHRKQVAAELERRKSLQEKSFSRLIDRPGEQPVEPAEGSEVTVWDMIQQARELGSWVGRYRQERSQRQGFGIDPDEVTVAEMIESLRTHLHRAGGRLEGSTLLSAQVTRSRGACLFLGMLEMARHREVRLEQQELFGLFWLEPTVGTEPI
jgi:segregation and condensation protein A